MRLCRFEHQARVRWGLYDEAAVVAIDREVAARLQWNVDKAWEHALPLGSEAWQALLDCIESLKRTEFAGCPRVATTSVRMLPPLERTPKLLLLAGNYAEHVREQGGIA